MLENEGKRAEPDSEIPAPSIEKKSFAARFWKEWGDVVIMLLVVFILGKVVFQLAKVPSGSMETTIPTRSLQIGWALPYVFGDPDPERGQILTFRSDERNETMVKRVIGLPGDTVSFVDGYVYVNGELLQEAYLDQQGVTYAASAFTVPEDCIFFLGDNRLDSYDARYWANPFIPKEKVRARVLLTISIGKNKSWQGVRLTGRSGS